MNAFVLGFVLISTFTIFVGIGAVAFIAWDGRGEIAKPTPTQSFAGVVRRINTETIETVDATGAIQQWKRAS